MCARFAVIDLDKNLKAAFYRFLKQKHGSIYGNVTKELDNFIKIGLAVNNFEDFPTKVSFLAGPNGVEIEKSGSHKNLTKRQKTLLLAFDKKFALDNKIQNKELTILIKKSLKVIDNRSVKKWTNYLILIEFIRKDSIHYWTNTSPVDLGEIYPELIVEDGSHD